MSPDYSTNGDERKRDTTITQKQIYYGDDREYRETEFVIELPFVTIDSTIKLNFQNNSERTFVYVEKG